MARNLIGSYIMYIMELGENFAPHVIEKTFVERDLGIMISSDLKWADQTAKATNAAKAIIVQWGIVFRTLLLILVRLLYLSLIRSHLEYTIPVWNPSLQRDIDNLANVQHKAGSRYEKEKICGEVKSIEVDYAWDQKEKRDLIEFYKILNGLESVSWKNELVKTQQS